MVNERCPTTPILSPSHCGFTAADEEPIISDSDEPQRVTMETQEEEEVIEAREKKRSKSKGPRRRTTFAHVAQNPDELEYTEEDWKRDLESTVFYQEIRAMLIDNRALRSQVDHLQDQVRELEPLRSQVEDLELMVAALRSEKELLDEEVLSMRGHVLRAERREGTPSVSKSHKLPDPPTFSGNSTDNLTFEDWLIRICGKLSGNADHFPTESLKLAYIVSRLSGDAAKHTAPRLREGSVVAYQTSQDLLDHLKEIYEDPGRVDKARQQFKSLYMKQSESFHDFYTRFLHLSAEAQISTTELLYELNDKLSFDLRSQVMGRFLDKPTLTEFARWCQATDDQIKTIASKKDRVRNKPGTARNSPAPSTMPDRTISTTSNTTRTVSGNNDIRPQYSDPDKQALSRIGACFQCKKPGHLAKFCPDKNRVAAFEEVQTDSGKGQP